MNKIQIKNITKKYNNLTALDDVSFPLSSEKFTAFWGETERANLHLSI